MTSRMKNCLTAVASVASGAALFVGFGLAQPAAAAEMGIFFYSGEHLDGVEVKADPSDYECHNLPQSMFSVQNFSGTNDVEVYWKADCVPGVPNSVYTDASYIVGNVNTGGTSVSGGFRSYRVLANPHG